MRQRFSHLSGSLAAALLLTGLAFAAVPPGEEDPTVDTDRDQTSVTPRVTPQGLEFQRLTFISPEEWNTPNPEYRELLQRIAAGTASKQIMRRYWWLHQRLTPFTQPIPSQWRELGLAQLTTVDAPVTTDGFGTDAAQIPQTGRWLSFGPTNIPGRVTGIARPAKAGPGTALVALADGGLFLTSDTGTTWQAMTNREATQAAGSVAADPRDPRRWYLGTGEGNGSGDNYGGIGVLRTRDAGRTWLVSNKFSNSVRCLAVDPSNTQRIYACGDSGVYRSTDGGVNFTLVGGGLPAVSATKVVFRPDDPTKMFASFWGGSPLYKSVDGGNTWSVVAGGLPASGQGRTDLDVCRANPNVMTIVMEAGNGDLWRSIDGGAVWTQVATAPNHCPGQCWYNQVVAIAPDDCNTIYLNGTSGYVTRNAGANFSQYPEDNSHTNIHGVHVDHHAIAAFASGEVIIGNDGGVYYSTDFGGLWTDISQGLPSSQYYGLCGSDVTADQIAGGTQDNGTHQRLGGNWRYVLGGDGGMCGIGGSKMMAEYQNANVQRSLDNGNSFQDANSGTSFTEPKPWVGIIERDPGNADTLYLGTSKVYRTTDFHNTVWKSIHTGSGGSYVGGIAASPVDRNVVWVGYENGTFIRSTNALATTPTWTDVRGTLPARSRRRVVPHPTSATGAWVVMGGFGNPKIMFTPNAGASYQDLTGDLPDVPVNDLVVDPGDLNVLIAATDLGIYRSLDNGAHWTGFSDALPTSAVIELFRHPFDGALFAGTHGRSAFRFQPASAGPVAVPDGSVIAGSQLLAERTFDGSLWLRWDTQKCTAERYHLFYGALTDVQTGTYSGALCNLSRGGEQVVAMPGAANQSLFMLMAGATAAGTEGPHSFTSTGVASPNSGVGFCGVTGHTATATCP